MSAFDRWLVDPYNNTLGNHVVYEEWCDEKGYHFGDDHWSEFENERYERFMRGSGKKRDTFRILIVTEYENHWDVDELVEYGRDMDLAIIRDARGGGMWPRVYDIFVAGPSKKVAKYKAHVMRVLREQE